MSASCTSGRSARVPLESTAILEFGASSSRSAYGAGDGPWKLRCGGGLAVACEGDYIGELALGCHLAQLCLERFEYHGSRVIRLMAGALGVEAVSQ